MAAPRHLILGTAGHIDHGKTSLVKALTGTDTDRLPEEKRRGITIELGFAKLDLGDLSFGVVDVPGHEKFVRTMVSGATGIDLALLVVAADDSVMPQTIEHVEILSLLGVTRGVVAVTKADLVEAEMVELVQEEVAQLLAGSGLPAWPAVAVSSTTGQGLDELRKAIRSAAGDIVRSLDSDVFRLAIDRVFVRPGRGTVVTGSVLCGRAAPGDTLALLPKGIAVRVRDVQSHGREAAEVAGGQRAALNLSGVDREQIIPGDELATPEYLTPAQIIDAEVTFVDSLARPVKPMSRVRFAAGTREVIARIVPLAGTDPHVHRDRDRETEGGRSGDADSKSEIPDLKSQISNLKSHNPGCPTLPGWGTEDRRSDQVHTSFTFGVPGARGYVQLRLAEPVAVEYGQRFILREENASRTLGGGVVLRFGPRRVRRAFLAAADGLAALRSDDPSARLEEVMRMAGFDRPTELALSAASGVPLLQVSARLAELQRNARLITLADGSPPLAVTTLGALGRRAEHWLERFHETRPDEPGCPLDRFLGWLESKSHKGLGRALLERMRKDKRVKVVGKYVCAPAFAPALSAQDEKIMAELIAELESAAFQPPAPAQLRAAASGDARRLDRLLKIAVAHGALVRIDPEIYLAASVEDRLREAVRGMAEAGEALTVGAVREKLNSSRKYVVPFLEHLDRVGFTRRVGDTRMLAGSNV